MAGARRQTSVSEWGQRDAKSPETNDAQEQSAHLRSLGGCVVGNWRDGIPRWTATG